MTDRPIIFSAPMIRALLDGRKTQTRRVLRPQPDPRAPIGGADFVVMGADDPGTWCWLNGFDGSIIAPFRVRYATGDRLWVREHWRCEARYDDFRPVDIPSKAPIYYAADPDPRDSEPGCAGRFRQGMHMPRWASRLTLTVTDVRVQRVHEISEADAIAEGIPPSANSQTIDCDTPRPSDSFRSLWNSIHGPGAWDANPWVAAISFTVERRNIDAVAG